MTQAHIFYTGLVQGVGFRYTVQRYAADLGLVGWVKNLRDGRVEILVEGEKETIDQLTQKLESHFSDYIRNKHIYFQPAECRVKDFYIAF